jgi:hypothetical protein
VSEWIKCGDRLPEKHEFILIAWDGEQYFPYDKIERKTMTTQGKKSKITHWMPLPEPPK